jgi:hypothetical protein
MAQYAEVTRCSTGFIDVPMYNNSAVAIDAYKVVQYDTAATGYPRCVKALTNGGGFATTAGVTQTSIPAYGIGMVCIFGPALCYGHDTTAQGAEVQPYDVTAHLGEYTAAAYGSTLNKLGHVLQAATADGDIGEIFVNLHFAPKAA